MTIRYDTPTHCTGVAQVGLIQLRDHFLGQGHVAIDNGIYACRDVRNSAYSTLSTHAEGRAWDPVFDTDAALQDAIDFLIEHAELLQVQEIIDYRGGRRWASNNDQAIDGGWEPYDEYGAGGWSAHFARNWDGALDPRPIEEVVEMPLSDADVEKVRNAVVAGLVPMIAPVVRPIVHEEIAKSFWGDDPKDKDARVPGGLIRRLRNWLRDQPK